MPIVLGQDFAGDRQVQVDFTEPDVERISVSHRLLPLSGGFSCAEAGVLSFDGESVFSVPCDIRSAPESARHLSPSHDLGYRHAP
ncbi:MAG: hypothetical protein Kow0026_11380 [Oricola sp.]